MIWLVAAALLVAIAIVFYRSKTRRLATLTILAERAFRSKDWSLAERLFRQSQELAATLPERVRTKCEAQISVGWGHSLYHQGKMRQAEEELRRGASKLKVACPGGNPMIAHAFGLWGDLCMDEGRYPEAEDHYRKATEANEKIGNPMLAFGLQRLAVALIQQSRRDEAARVLDQCTELETRITHLQLLREGKEPGQHQIISMSFPDVCFCQERYVDARRLYREKVQFYEKLVTLPDNIDVGNYLMRLAASEAASGDRPAAIETYRRAVRRSSRDWSERHPKVAVAMARLARLLAQEGRTTEATEIARSAQAIFEESQLQTHPDLAPLDELLSDSPGDR